MSDIISTNGEILVTEVGRKAKKLQTHRTSKLIMDKVRNPRSVGVYSGTLNDDLARDIYDNGLTDPPYVNVRASGEIYVLRGHRRITAIHTIWTQGVPATKDGRPAIPADPKFMPEIQCITYNGLSLSEEMDLVMDHQSSVALSKKEQFVAAKNMQACGYSHELIAKKFGGSRSNYTNFFAKMMKLPDVVQDTYLSTDENAPEITQGTVKVLFEKYQEDQKQPGAKYRVGGELFNAAWEDFVKNGAPARPRTLNFEELNNLMNPLRANEHDLRDLLQAIRDANSMAAFDALNRIRNLLVSDPSFTRVEEGISTTVGDYVPVDPTY